MSLHWRRPAAPVQLPQVLDRSDEIDAATQANQAALADAAQTHEHTRRLAARVERIHGVLMQEGADNHFTERWRRAWGGD